MADNTITKAIGKNSPPPKKLFACSVFHLLSVSEVWVIKFRYSNHCSFETKAQTSGLRVLGQLFAQAIR